MDNHREIFHYFELLRNGFIQKDRDGLLDSFREFASSHRNQVEDALSKVDPFENELFWNFLESICDEADEWSESITALLARLFSAAEILEDPAPVLNSLEAFHLIIREKDDAFMLNIRSVCKLFINTYNVPLKRFTVWLYFNCIYKAAAADLKLIRILKRDADIIIRYYAFVTYNTLLGYPAAKGLTSIDKLLLNITDVFTCRDISLHTILHSESILLSKEK